MFGVGGVGGGVRVMEGPRKKQRADDVSPFNTDILYLWAEGVEYCRMEGNKYVRL